MGSREKILSSLKAHLAGNSALPPLVLSLAETVDLVSKLTTVLSGIGGSVVQVDGWADITVQLKAMVGPSERMITTIPELGSMMEAAVGKDPHLLENVRLAVLRGRFAVAENGAVWITSDMMGDRALPFICERLALIVSINDIVKTMFDAYEKIGDDAYEFGTFIAGPSKTADIEQSLVLGAHGPKSMTLFLLKE